VQVEHHHRDRDTQDNSRDTSNQEHRPQADTQVAQEPVHPPDRATQANSRATGLPVAPLPHNRAATAEHPRSRHPWVGPPQEGLTLAHHRAK